MKNAIISIDKKCEFDKIRGDNMFELINYEEENFQTHENQDFVMSKKKKKDKTKLKKFAFIASTISSCITLLVTSGFIVFIISFYGDYRSTDTKVEMIGTSVSNVETQMNQVQKDLVQFKNTIYDDLTSVKKDVKDAVKTIYTAGSNFVGNLNVAETNSQTSFLKTPSWKSDDIIAKNPLTGRKYKAKDLMNKKILIPYKDDGQDAYFFGQFNKQNHWDGDCLINLYDKKRRLTMIMEGRYNDGKLESYRQVGYYKNHLKQWVWNVSERETKGNINTGETYTYYKNKNKKAAFTKKTVEASDIMSVADFKEWITGAMEGYYCGNTQNGAYNDNTGKAYLIKYDKGKKVRTLYCGKFKNGAFHDESGNAWYISYDAENSTYIYFKGKFVNNKPVETSTHKRENISLNEIHQIMKGKHFNESVDLHEK